MKEIVANRVIGVDGSSAEVDAIIFGTGFHILDMPVSSKVFDGDGRSLDDHWKGSPQAYLGTTVAGFPNLYLLLGPSLGTGHTSAFMILEAQLGYAIDAIGKTLRNGWASVRVRPEVQNAFNDEVQAALPGTVYQSGGCASYYTDVNGRNSFSWPFSTAKLRARVRDFAESDYLIETAAAERTSRATSVR